jgi:hypothetical protein
MTRQSTKKSEDKDKPASSSGAGRIVIVIIILCFVGIMPVLIWLSIPPTSTYSTVNDASQYVATAAADTDLQICTQNAVVLNYPGVQNAAKYNLSPDCNTATAANTVVMGVIGFSSTEAQANALNIAMNSYKNWRETNTEVYTDATSVIIVTGPPGNTNVQAIGNSLAAQGAEQVT